MDLGLCEKPQEDFKLRNGMTDLDFGMTSLGNDRREGSKTGGRESG